LAGFPSWGQRVCCGFNTCMNRFQTGKTAIHRRAQWFPSVWENGENWGGSSLSQKRFNFLKSAYNYRFLNTRYGLFQKQKFTSQKGNITKLFTQ
jgi:hypothetical protein